MKKLEVIYSIFRLPDNQSIDRLILEKIDKGRIQIKEGKVNSEEQADAKLAKWLS